MSQNQNQAKANVGSVISAMDVLIAQANSNAQWNEAAGASHSPALLRALSVDMQAKRVELFALYQGQEDITSISS